MSQSHTSEGMQIVSITEPLSLCGTYSRRTSNGISLSDFANWTQMTYYAIIRSKSCTNSYTSILVLAYS
ncbi:hypothetical protein J6590_082673 [Homalodisca vitripennis]|nr:hypothetical protein J6590_082673 [Homalodisca vitripennis]